MESTLIEFDQMTAELRDHVDQLGGYIGKVPISKKLKDGFTSFYQHLKQYSEATEGENLGKIVNSASAVATYGQVIGQAIAQFQEADTQMKTFGIELVNKSILYKNVVENTPLQYEKIEPINSKDSNFSSASYQSIKKNLKQLANTHLEHDQRIKKLLSESESRASNLSSRIVKMEHDATVEIDKISSLYKDSLIELESKKQQIDDVLGHASGRVIAGDFEKSSAEEKELADWLRYASLGCMAIIVAVVGYSFWETTTDNFQWQSSIFRIFLGIILSVPAAYLARESAKHREQQYSHLQTSLDLKAITPYIASLPTDEQHKIKVEVATRLFAAKDYSRVGADPYPINVHEIVMELIKKLELKK